MFALRDVTVRYPTTAALKQVSLSIGAGEVVGLVGPSGSGKTTLLRTLNGGIRPTSGQVEVNGSLLTALTEAQHRALRCHIGFVAQTHDLVPTLRAGQNVLLGRIGQMGWLRSAATLLWPSRSALEEAHQRLIQVGIGDKIFQRTDTLSGGEQQRVAIARALHQEPVAVLADEPVASVDPTRGREILDLLTGLAKQRGACLVVSLHDLPLARTLPRLVGLRAGEVVFDAPPDTLDDQDFAQLYESGA
jgi:phosphonate transport system ATP-binding protein